jgi:hypothetical protein
MIPTIFGRFERSPGPPLASPALLGILGGR